MSWYRFFKCKMEELEEFLYLTFFLYNSNDLTRQLIPSYKNFHGPADDFNNITGDEFVFSEDYYLKYSGLFPSLSGEGGSDRRSETDEANRCLNELVAILYRPLKKNYDTARDPDGDLRVPFNQNICAYNARHKIKRWPLHIKLAIFHWYQGCRQKMIDDNPDIFTGGNSEPAKYGLLSVMRTIAEGGIHGDFDKVQKMYVKMWMMELNEKMEEGKKIEKAYKK